MKADYLEKLEQWASMMTLMGFDPVTIYEEEDYEEDSDECVLLTINAINRLAERQAAPDKTMRAALLTMEMGISERDIGNYVNHIWDLESKAEETRRQELIDNNVTVKKLREKHKFALVQSKQYKTYTHFEFETAKGTKVSARYKYDWAAGSKVYYKYREDGKLQQREIHCSGSLRVPNALPEAIMDRNEVSAMTVAWYLTFGNIPQRLKSKMVKPK